MPRTGDRVLVQWNIDVGRVGLGIQASLTRSSPRSLTFPPIPRITPAFRRNFVRALYRDDPVTS